MVIGSFKLPTMQKRKKRGEVFLSPDIQLEYSTLESETCRDFEDSNSINAIQSAVATGPTIGTIASIGTGWAPRPSGIQPGTYIAVAQQIVNVHMQA